MVAVQVETNSYVEAQDAVNLFLKQCRLSGLEVRPPTRIGRHSGALGRVESPKPVGEAYVYGWIRMEDNYDGTFSLWSNLSAYDEWEFKDVYKMLEKANDIIRGWI